jgi:hypothetical protein
MSHIAQFSFPLDYPTSGFSLHRVLSHDFVRPEDFLKAIVQHGNIKMHGLVDTSTPETEHQFFLIGTGKRIPKDLVEILDRIFHVATISLSDGKYGYHLYGVKKEAAVAEKDAQPYKYVEIAFRLGASDADISDIMSRVHDFVGANAPAVRYEPQSTKTVLVLALLDRDAEVERSEDFLELRADLEDDESTIQSFRVYSA